MVLCCLVQTFAQRQMWRGTVIDADDGAPMECVNVYVAPGRGSVTNVEGEFIISAEPDESVRLSFVGYKTLTIKANSIRRGIKLSPLNQSIAEVTVLTDNAIIGKVMEKLNKDYSKNQSKYSTYFNRLTYKNDINTEMIESFIEAQSAVHLRHLKLSTGNHWALNRRGDATNSSFKRTNMHLLLSMGPMIKVEDEVSSMMKVLFPKGANLKNVLSRYDVKRIDYNQDNAGDAVACFRFIPKKGLESGVMEGNLYVDVNNYRLLRFSGKISRMAFTKGYGTEQVQRTETNEIEINLNVNYSHDNGYTEVADMAAHVHGERVDFTSLVTNVTKLNLPLTYARDIGQNLLSTIEEIGYNPEVFSQYNIIERTEEEKRLAKEQTNVSENASSQDITDDGIPLIQTLSASERRAPTSTLEYIRHAMRFNDKYPQEKVYLHLDNTAYFKGETIWFKAYVKRADEDVATDLSKVLYVELLNPQGDVVEKRTLPIVHGVSKGDIRVDSIMVTGFYEIRAFTRYMTNWGTDACFSRVIPIFKAPKYEGDWSNPSIDIFSYRNRLNDERQKTEGEANANVVDFTDADNAGAKPLTDSKGDIKVRFFPEGGHLVKGLRNRIALLVTDKDGTPQQVQVSLLAKTEATADNLLTDTIQPQNSAHSTTSASSIPPQNSVPTIIATDAFGRAVIDVLPEQQSAKVNVAVSSNKNYTFPLPPCTDSGCALVVDATGAETVEVDISATADVLGKNLAYVVMNGGKVVRCDTLTAAPQQHLSFVRKHLPQGVNQLTLFDADGRILAERLFFIYPDEKTYNSITVKTKGQTIKPCGRVQFELVSQPFTNISFSAVDAAGLLNGPHGNLSTYMLLDSELRGYIARPEYYLESDDEVHRLATDRLMMVQGWRRYDWRLMSGQSSFVNIQPVEDRLYLMGSVKTQKKRNKDKPLDVSVLFSRPGVEPFGGTITTDSVGQFAFALPDLANSWDLRLIARDGEESVKGIIAIDRLFAPKARYISPEETQVIPTATLPLQKWDTEDEDSLKWISLNKRDIVLKNVTVKAKGRFWDRTNWSNERNATILSNIRYDCDAAADRYADMGMDVPLFTEWLKEKNSLFAGEVTANDRLIGLPEEALERNDDGSYVMKDLDRSHSSTGLHVVLPLEDMDPEQRTNWRIDPPAGYIFTYADGLTYKNRPIAWIVDNQFCTATSMKRKGGTQIMNLASPPSKITGQAINVFNNDNAVNTNTELPITLDEVKSVFISEDNKGLRMHFDYDDLESQNFVIVYLFTHRSFEPRQKNARYTHYQGFNVPSKFQMEDYNTIPPMEDVRRTIYWNPTVITDANGRATVEFWNNSSCTQMYISADGLTKEGKCVSY